MQGDDEGCQNTTQQTEDAPKYIACDNEFFDDRHREIGKYAEYE
ncbi:MAG: hypothetical protein RBQ80_00095 [Methanocorpusculum sp.]|jgi:hypothetical protein|nr:hypothetical protein [Methanocorpusculum sp.]